MLACSCELRNAGASEATDDAPAAPLTTSTPEAKHCADVIAAILEGGVLESGNGTEALGDISDGAYLGRASGGHGEEATALLQR